MSREEADELCRKLSETLDSMFDRMGVYTVASRPELQLADLLEAIAKRLLADSQLHVDLGYRLKAAAAALKT
jgi:hypothetical protein